MNFHTRRYQLFKGFGFRFSFLITDEYELINEFSLIAFYKTFFIFAYADALWVDEEGKPYICWYDEGTFFIGKFAFSISF